MSFAESQVKAVFQRTRVDALLFWSLENIRYLCGFTGSDGALVVTRREKIFLSDSRYEEQAKGEIRGTAFRKYKKKIDGVAQSVKSLKVRRLGFEAGALNYESYLSLKEKLPRMALIPLARELANLRARKEPEEIERVRGAIQIASDSFLDAWRRLKPGTREKKVGDFMEIRMKQRGGRRPGISNHRRFRAAGGPAPRESR